MLLTVKSREVQRGMLAEMAQRREEAARHFLAAAHLEFVLAHDYELAGETSLARRNLISAASCLWRAGKENDGREIFAALIASDPVRAPEIQAIVDELTQSAAP